MAVYLDTSCVLKLLWPEPETARTVALVRAEDRVIVSEVTWLETKVRIQARHASGALTRSGARTLLRKAESLVSTPPFERPTCAAGVLGDAAAQVDVGSRSSHCRSLDRLHLAAMLGLGLDRLVTNDDARARAARSLGLMVLLPR
ncbi:MAG: type II toxin-antitoxin system VapC family toxin [Deltaproteobacteria bacterium]|nr:type II toxin-antitoxin system VapC family toxin [Deltaproteobacteria bacterium]